MPRNSPQQATEALRFLTISMQSWRYFKFGLVKTVFYLSSQHAFLQAIDQERNPPKTGFCQLFSMPDTVVGSCQKPMTQKIVSCQESTPKTINFDHYNTWLQWMHSMAWSNWPLRACAYKCNVALKGWKLTSYLWKRSSLHVVWNNPQYLRETGGRKHQKNSPVLARSRYYMFCIFAIYCRWVFFSWLENYGLENHNGFESFLSELMAAEVVAVEKSLLGHTVDFSKQIWL